MVFFQHRCIFLQDRRISRTDVIFIKVEVNVLEQRAFKNHPFDAWGFLRDKTFFKFFFGSSASLSFALRSASALAASSFLTDGSSFTTVFFGQPIMISPIQRIRIVKMIKLFLVMVTSLDE